MITFSRSWIWHIATCATIMVGFLWYYMNISRSLPFRYYDEAWWTGDSYFFDLLIHDRSHPVWKSVYAYDQPKLVHYLFGLALYPGYIRQKQMQPELTYLAYLGDHHLLCIECIGQQYVAPDSERIAKEEFERNIETPEFGKTRQLIFSARRVNAVLAACTVAVVYIFGLGLWGTWGGVIFALLYGMNSLVIRTVLPAHAEAALLLFYSLALTSLYGFIRKRTTTSLLVFAVSTGLAASVKLSGFVLEVIWIFAHRQYRRVSADVLKESCIVLLVSMGIFAILNPSVQPAVIPGLMNMVWHRSAQQALFPVWYPEDSLSGISAKALSIFTGYFRISPAPFSAPYPIFGYTGWANIAYVIAFSFGLIAIVRKLFASGKKIMEAVYVLVILNVIVFATLVWLTVRWERYYVLLVLPMLAIQIEGVRFIGILCLRNVRRK